MSYSLIPLLSSKISFFGGEAELQRKRSLLPAGALPTWQQWPGLAQGEARTQKLPPDLPKGEQGPKRLAHLLRQVHHWGAGFKSGLFSPLSGIGKPEPIWNAVAPDGSFTGSTTTPTLLITCK